MKKQEVQAYLIGNGIQKKDREASIRYIATAENVEYANFGARSRSP